MKDRPQLEFGLGLAATKTHYRDHPEQTRERGRKYPRNKICPTCFRPFTSKGIGPHRHRCTRVAADTKALLGPPPTNGAAPSKG